MKAKKISVLAIVICAFSLTAQAQWGGDQMADKPSLRDRMFFGGGFGLSFSSSYDYFSLSPIIGYKLAPRVATGVSIIYRYTKYKYTPSISTNDYGASPFIRYQFYGPLFLHAEYEYLNYQYVSYNTGELVRKPYTSFMAGGGFFQPVGRKAGLYISALYNFSYKSPTSPYDYYPYSSPLVIRAGITAGF